ncbi:1,4-dihydroxy-2-naphthoate polyprenyltransferase [Oceanobacillus alkalisoli]|uniref:1,4-dihydroxy-2-naphthoate polyprenyltransferase n=1 Tax=Oceanobacillus alkalisoli TaxID=2925113 RepID=UPI001EF06E00|nr:1,4-dihydroxy-2-naphthoate polyprenyltransferase [Oceanobacillus alkalisoli]MCF3943481.1 1,4-dihydroxy-2-naphthoate polyprenyltransferase [Oceanobacillus alkalisoli]MCG5104069.1 1,4-dihydroxy-2-naphthoate polyprenyltransferase [Oceanobacillus alkalisoli]
MDTVNKNSIKEALNEKSGFDVWWRLMRPHTLTASFIPVFVGTMLAYHDGTINWTLFLAMLVASLLIQAATNMFNEYYDYKLGLDTEESVGIGGTIVRDGVEPRTIRNLAVSFYGIAVILGVYICMESSWWIAVIGLICMAIGYLYTGGPIPISYTPFGELFSGVLMGTVIIGITYFIQTLTMTSEVIWISIPVTIFIGSINLSNNIRDRDGDKLGGRKTIAVLVGREKAITLLAVLFIIAYGWTLGLIMAGLLPIWTLITFFSIPKAVAVIKNFRGKTEPLEMMPAMIATGKTNTIYGFLLGISLVIAAFA